MRATAIALIVAVGFGVPGLVQARPKPTTRTAPQRKAPARLRVITNATVFDCTVDGAECKRDGDEIVVAPGDHVLELSADGYHSAAIPVEARSGATQSVPIALDPLEVPPALPEPTGTRPTATGVASAPMAPRAPAPTDAPKDEAEDQPEPLRLSVDSWTMLGMRHAFRGTDPSSGAIVEDRSTTGLAQVFEVAYGVTDRLYLVAYGGLVYLRSVDGTKSLAASNPSLLVAHSLSFRRHLSLGLAFTVSVPVGSGGGRSPKPAVARAAAMGRNLMGMAFSPNHLQLRPDIRFGYRNPEGFTLEARAFPAVLVRARGDDTPVEVWAQTSVIAGYAVTPTFQPFVQLQYNASLTTQPYIEHDPSLRDYLWGVAGASFRVPVRDVAIVRPFMSVFRALNDPFRRQGWMNMLLFGLGVDL